MTVAAELARFVADLRYDDLPAAIRHEAKRSLLNYFGAALGAWIEPDADAMLRILAPLSGPAKAGVIGRPDRLDILSATFLNALAANLLDFDDTHMPTIIHPSAPVAPPLFALAERDRMSGQALIAAFVAGTEIACRMGNAVSPGHYARGWHITATCGIFGAAAASGKALALPAERIAHALGIAGSQSSGLVANLTNGAKNVQVGNAARNGLFAALAAQGGYTAASETIEGPRGWGAATGDAPDVRALVEGLGDTWELSKNAYKASPCGIVLAPVIDAALDLRNRERVRGEAVERIVVRGNPLLLTRADRPDVPNDRIAKLSLQHSVAVAILRGAAGVEEFGGEAVRDPIVAALRARVAARADAALSVGEAVVTAVLADGREVTVHVTEARGSLAKPLTDAEIETKLRDLARLGAPGLDVSRLIEAVWSLDRLDDAGSVMASARSGGKTTAVIPGSQSGTRNP